MNSSELNTRDLLALGGRHALVTGGSRGLGLEFARAMGHCGAVVTLVSRKEGDLRLAVDHLADSGIAANFVVANLTDPASAEAIVTRAIDAAGPIDILVNNAGATWGAPAEEHPYAAWEKVLTLNLSSAFLMAQSVARHAMIPRSRGRIINVASVGGLRGSLPDQQTTAAYHASKGGLINLTRALAAEWGRYGITVNALAPWYFLTDMTRATIGQRQSELAQRVPLGRLGKAQDLWGPVAFLASDMSQYITGQVLALDGGFTAV